MFLNINREKDEQLQRTQNKTMIINIQCNRYTQNREMSDILNFMIVAVNKIQEF